MNIFKALMPGSRPNPKDSDLIDLEFSPDAFKSEVFKSTQMILMCSQD